MRRAARTDDNQLACVAALRAVGASVQPLHGVGDGCPDLLVGHRGRNVLIELKDGEKCPSARRLTSAQVSWQAAWRGDVIVAFSPAECLAALGLGVQEAV